MGGKTSEESAGLGLLEPARSESFGRADAGQPEASHKKGVVREPHPSEQLIGNLGPAIDERAVETPVCISVAPEPGGRCADIALQYRSAIPSQRMREGDLRMDHLEPVLRQRKAAEERRREDQRMDRGADVMDEPGTGQLGRPRSPTDLSVALDQEDRRALSSQGHRRGKAIGARTDDDRIEIAHPTSAFNCTASTASPRGGTP